MHVFRGVLALSLCVSFCAYNLPLYAGGKPLGILTMAYGAHLNASAAFAGVSVFDGESVSTEPEGKLSRRIGAAARGSPSAGAGSDVRAKDSADHCAAWESGLFLWKGISRFAGGADLQNLFRDGRRSAGDVRRGRRYAKGRY